MLENEWLNLYNFMTFSFSPCSKMGLSSPMMIDFCMSMSSKPQRVWCIKDDEDDFVDAVESLGFDHEAVT